MVSIWRSSSTTGIFASLASFSTESQPVATTGAMKIASTPWATKERTALIWFSCFCWASEIFRSMPRLSASALAVLVSAARQPNSEPICEKPTTSFLSAAWTAPSPMNRAAAAVAAEITHFLDIQFTP